MPVTTPPGSDSHGQEGAPTRPEGQLRLGAALRRAWVGYQRHLDQEMAAAGFGDRSLPDGRVLRMCASAAETTVSHIGRELGITRQGASKIVAGLRERGYVTLRWSARDGREKIVTLTPRADDFLAAHRKAADTIERRLRTKLGATVFADLDRLVSALGGDEDLRMSDYLRESNWSGRLRRGEE